MSIRQGGKIIAGSGQFMPLFSFVWADHQLNDISWLCADTYSWQSGAVYQVAYAHLVLDIASKTLQSETVAGTTIQFYLADDGHKICPESEESNVTAIYNATGVAWYYIIDTTNTRFKLPRTKYGFQGIKDSVGKYDEAGLPNITGKLTSYWGHFQPDLFEGAFVSGSSKVNAAANGTNSGADVANFSASGSNPIYGNSDTVQPPATEMYLYFYVGNFTQTALENTAGITAETLNDKVDKGHQVIEFQAPTAANNYTWYRKYADGWVEQGGITGAINGVATTAIVTLPVEMSDANYSVYITITRDAQVDYRDQFLVAGNRSVTGFTVYSNWAGSDRGTANNYGQWEVKGIAAN